MKPDDAALFFVFLCWVAVIVASALLWGWPGGLYGFGLPMMLKGLANSFRGRPPHES